MASQRLGGLIGQERGGRPVHAEAEEGRMAERHHARVADEDVRGHGQQPPDQDLRDEALPERRQHERRRGEERQHDPEADPVAGRRPGGASRGRRHLGVGTNSPVGRKSMVRTSTTKETITAWAGLTTIAA